MKTTCLKFAITGCFLLATTFAFAQTKMVGGAEMNPDKNIMENLANSKAHTTLVKAIQTAGLMETLKGEGPFTVFAPVNNAFAAFSGGTVKSLLEPGNRKKLQMILTYHIVPGNWSASEIAKMIRDNGGKVELKTMNGGTLTAMMNGVQLMIMDEMGNTATVSISDVNQSNGVVHVVDAVLMPRM